MAGAPDTLELKRHRDLEGIFRGAIWVRRSVVAALTAFCVLALLNLFGQRPKTVRADAAAASLSLYAPTTLRGGDFMQARFHITAKRDLGKVMLKLDPGWGEGVSINTIEPAPVDETSDDGRLSFELGPLSAGQDFILFMQFQVNPTNVAWHRPQNVELDDGDEILATIHRTITILP